MMNDKTNDDLSKDIHANDQHADLGDDFGDLTDEQFDDYGLDDTEHSDDMDNVHPDEALDAETHSEDEATEAPINPPSDKKGMADLLKENWLFIVIGAVVVFIAGYMIYGVLEPSAPQSAPAQQAQSSFGLPQPKPQAPVAAQQPSAPQPMQMAQTPSLTMTQSDFQALMQGFQQMVQQNSQNIEKSLQTVIQNTNQANNNAAAILAMQQQFASLNAQMSHYNQAISGLNDRLTTLQSQLTLLVAQQTAQAQQLTLRAVVPGRAWLIDGKGRTISVTVGSQLGGFGIVTNIDSGAGMVTTSSGYVFK